MTSSLPDPPAAGRLAAGVGRGTGEAGRGSTVPWFIDPREVAYTLRQRVWWVVLPAAVVLALALASLVILPARYTATAIMLIDPKGAPAVNGDVTSPGQTTGAGALLVDSQMAVVSSDTVLRKVIDRFGLDHDPEFVSPSTGIGQLPGVLSSMLGTSAGPHDATLDALRSLRDRLVVRRLERTSALSIGVTTDSPEKSAAIAQGVAETDLAENMPPRDDVARPPDEALSARLAALQADERDADDKAKAYRAEQAVVGARAKLASEQQRAKANDQLRTARARAAAQMTDLRKVEKVLKNGGPVDGLPEALRSPAIGNLGAQLALAERTLAVRQTILGDRHPAMVAAKDDVVAAKAHFNAAMQRLAASVREQYRSAEANVALLGTALDKAKTKPVPVEGSTARLRDLDRQVEARRSAYDAALVQARDLQAQQKPVASTSRIIVPASAPPGRDGASPPLVLIAALAAGLGLGIGGALLAEQVSGRVRTSRRLSRHLGLDVVGAIPSLTDHAYGSPPAAAAEQEYDLAVTRLRNHVWRAVPGTATRCIMVTAADAASGKSLLAMRLAMIAATEGERVLLVDADPNASLPAEFNLPIVPLAPRLQDSRTFMPERGVAQIAGLRYVSVSSRTAKSDFKTVADNILARASEFHAIVINAGLVGADLFTERLAIDTRLSSVLLVVSASHSRFAVVDRALTKFDREATLAAVLTNASSLDV